MKKILKSILDFLVFSNIFMALCAVAQGLVTFHLINSKPSFAVLAILFAATLGVYNFSIIIPKPAFPQKSKHYRIRWFFARYNLMAAITIISFLVLVPLFFYVSFESKALLIIMTFLSLGYSIPLFKIGNRKFGLRHVPGLKPLMITLVWTLSCVLLPILEVNDLHLAKISLADTTILVAKRFFFIGALTIPFDIRDLYDDKQTNLRTIPVAWGEKNAYLFCQVLLAAYVVLLFLFRNQGFSTDFWALTATVLLTGWLIFKAKWEKNEYYYFVAMDGILVLQYVALLTFTFVASHI